MPHVRPTDASPAEVRCVAARMQATLVEVVGPVRGAAMYDLAWLEDRVREHLDPARLTGAVLVCVDDDAAKGAETLGHTIVRVEEDNEMGRHGLFSTTYVVPSARRNHLATLLLDAGEAWMREQGLAVAVTYTDPDNVKLIRLFEARGYECSRVNDEFVRLSARLEATNRPQPDAGRAAPPGP